MGMQLRMWAHPVGATKPKNLKLVILIGLAEGGGGGHDILITQRLTSGAVVRLQMHEHGVGEPKRKCHKHPHCRCQRGSQCDGTTPKPFPSPCNRYQLLGCDGNPRCQFHETARRQAG